MKRIILFVLYCSLHHTLFAQTVDLATGNNSVRIRAGNANTVFDNNQILFSYYSGTGYSHAIKTRHDAGSQLNNSIDFYVWKPGNAINDVGSNHVMSLNGGNVGIGTTNPGLKLHLATSNNLDGLGLYHSNGAWATIFSPSMTGGAYNGITQPEDAGVIFGNVAGINSVSNGFVIAPHRSTTSGLRINNNGDVGIGISNPGSFKLAVAGKIWGQEIQVALSIPGPDYVFEEGYTLPSLDSVQSYINQNKHLPEVPSAKEMEANGVNLGEMNMLLLKKVEELTLYMIEQKETNNKQSKEIEFLKSIISNKN